MHSFESVCFIQIVIVFLLYSYVNPSTGSHSTSSQDLQQEASVHLMQQLSSLEDPHNQVLLDKREASPHGFPTTYINSSSWSAANTPPSQSHLLTIEDDAMECIFVRSEDGVYRFWADNSLTHTLDEVCGLYMIARPDQLIQFDFQRLNVSCDGSNALSIVDGWELNGQLFPSSNDHQLERSLRFRPVCGNQVPFSLRTVRMSQNVALLQFRIQSPGEGFQVNVRFIPNPMPCNAVFQLPQGVHTLRNYGQKSNCSVSILFPQSIRVLSASVGMKSVDSNSSEINREVQNTNRSLLVDSKILDVNQSTSNGQEEKCEDKNGDFVQMLGGDGLDTGLMKVATNLCPFIVDSAISSKVNIACENTAVRLISSGQFENSITVAFDLLLEKSHHDSLSCDDSNSSTS